MSDTLYSLDASGLIAGWVNYPIAVFPGLWSKLETLIEEGRLLIAEDVYNEIRPKDKELEGWLKRLRSAIVPLDDYQQGIVGNIMNCYNLGSTLSGKSMGDPFVIALAKVKGAIVITDEKPTGNLNGPRIPDVCKAEGVDWRNFVEILKREGWSFK